MKSGKPVWREEMPSFGSLHLLCYQNSPGPGKMKIETITDPYKGSVDYLNKCLEISLNTN
jgi:hypothetical protein